MEKLYNFIDFYMHYAHTTIPLTIWCWLGWQHVRSLSPIQSIQLDQYNNAQYSWWVFCCGPLVWVGVIFSAAYTFMNLFLKDNH